MEQAEVHEPAHVLDETHVLAWLMPMASTPYLYNVLQGLKVLIAQVLHSSHRQTRSPNSTSPITSRII